MTKEENIKLLHEAVEKGEYPSILYKFRDLGDRTLKIIEKSEIWFATAESFNDPFDCDLSETREHTPQDLKNYLKHIDESIGLKGGESDKITTLFETDPEKIREICINARAGAVNKKGILSLSEGCDNILM